MRYITVWVRVKVQTFHWCSFRVMRPIILYSAVYQLRVASPAHVNEITMPTCLSTFTQHEHTRFLRDQWKFIDSNRFGLTDRSDISAVTLRAVASLFLLCVLIPDFASSAAQMCSNTCWSQCKASGNQVCCPICSILMWNYATIIVFTTCLWLDYYQASRVWFFCVYK